MFWIDSKRGNFVDWLTQVWVRLSGQSLDAESCPWLDGASGPTNIIGFEAFEQFAKSKGLLKSQVDNPRGILPSFNKITSKTFKREDIHDSVIEFYETTSDFQIKIHSQWSSLFKPGGWLLSILFSKRLQQLNVPLSRGASQLDMTNEIEHWVDPESGAVELVLWLRSIQDTGHVAYSGSYSVCFLDSVQCNCVKVVFPLPNGRAVVLFRPVALEDGSLRLSSVGEKMGDPGFYFVVESNKRYYVKYVRSFRERITVRPDIDGGISADHELSLWGMNFLKMHYQMKRSSP
jgi:hypothetical protein